MATKENNVKANESNVTNESATATAKVESAKVESESNATDGSNEQSANTESKQEATSAPTAEEIATAKVEQKHQKEIGERYQMETPKEVEVSKFAGAYVLGVYRPTSDRKNSDKTFYKIFYNGKIFDGYSATEFCDAVGIERKHRNGTTKKEPTLLEKLEALKALLDVINVNDTDFVNFSKIVVTKIESEKLESDRSAFVAKYAAAIALFSKITEATCSEVYGADVLTLAKKLGYKFKDTKATGTATESK